MNTATRIAYDRAGFARHGITMAMACANPIYRAILRCTELAEARRQARADAALARETHSKGDAPCRIA